MAPTSPTMKCGICSKSFGYERKPTCPSCAIATIYELRYNHARGLLENERVRQNVDSVTRGSLDPDELLVPSVNADLVESAKKISVQDIRAQITLVEARVAEIKVQQDLLRAQLEQARADNAARKASLLEQKAADCREKEALAQLIDSVSSSDVAQTESARLVNKLIKIRDRMADGRRTLCKETAALLGLRTRRRRLKDGQVKEEVMIGGLPIPDLREINLVRPDQLSACLATITRLLAITCCYLSVRLPAEIRPFCPDHSQPTILSLQSSYQAQDDHAKDLSQSHFMRKASQARIQAGRSAQPKHRLLSIDKPLPRLAKEDSPTYNLFIEGVTLLAYDIAWLSRSQGVTAQLDKWEDICPIGQNLYRLFFGPSSEIRFGSFSHATSWHKNLSGPEGMELMVRSWELPSLATVSDKIKSFLLTEMSGAEWELLDEAEWTQEREDERAVLVGGSRSKSSASMLSTVTVEPADETHAATEPDKPGRGEKGWTKLKSRAHET